MTQEKCPKCGSTKVAGLVESFWCSVSDWHGSSSDICVSSETELSDARLCSDCENRWNDEDTVDGLRRKIVSLEAQIARKVKTPAKPNILTEEDVRAWASRQGIVLADHEVADISEDSSCDPLEGVEWLPFYKASCLQLVQLVGILSKHVAEGLRPDKAMVDSWKRCWRLSLALSGCGASTDPDALKRSHAMIRENEAFDWADYMKKAQVGS